MKDEIVNAAKVVKEGGVILYPTDTIWGLGCDPTNDEAINKLLQIKNRTAAKSLVVLVHTEALLQRYVKEIPEVCYDLLDFSDKPLTIVYPSAQHVSALVAGEDNSIAIRLTKDEFCVQLITRLKSGIISTSANMSGKDAPMNLKEVSEEVKKSVDYVVNLPGRLGTSKPSQIIKIKQNSEVEIIRK